MPPDHARAVALEVAAGLMEDGAEAVVLVGSHAGGYATPLSDVDLLAAGPREFSFRLERRGGLLVSVSSRPPEAYRRELSDPASVCAAVPGWRGASVLHDPRGTAQALIRAARAWSWAPLEVRCDRWVAEEICAFAEEVHKLVSALRDGCRATAAAQRAVLAVRLAGVMAVRRRILYASENRLWDILGEEMGEGWRRTQSAALGLDDERFEDSCRAALRLYALAASEARSLFGERQRAVVDHALRLTGFPGY